MDIQAPDTTFSNISLGDPSFHQLTEFLSESREDDSHHLCLFLGVYEPDKSKAVERVSQAVGMEVEKIDFENIVSKSEEETFRNLDRLFEGLKSSESILYFKNGDKLCGAYTGFTHSKVKYATPQERYFLKKVQQYGGIVIVDITSYTAADKTMRRAAQSTVTFPLPDSPLKRFLWHMKHYSFHGFQLKSKRPESYGEDTSL